MRPSRKIFKIISVFTIAFTLSQAANVIRAEDLSYIEELFSVRDSFAAHSKDVSETLFSQKTGNVRELERIFELNSSNMTAIEAYFKIFRIVFTQERTPTDRDLRTSAEWLEFILEQCKYDLEFLEAKLHEPLSPLIRKHTTAAHENVRSLASAAQKGLSERKISIP